MTYSLTTTGSFSRVPRFADFAEQWMEEMKIQWRTSHYDTNQGILDQYLIKAFGKVDMSQISKAEIIAFRAKLGGLKVSQNKAMAFERDTRIAFWFTYLHRGKRRGCLYWISALTAKSVGTMKKNGKTG